MNIGIITINIYIITSFFWAIFATKQQIKRKDKNWKIYLSFIQNFIFCPICILLVIINENKNEKKYKLSEYRIIRISEYKLNNINVLEFKERQYYIQKKFLWIFWKDEYFSYKVHTILPTWDSEHECRTDLYDYVENIKSKIFKEEIIDFK